MRRAVMAIAPGGGHLREILLALEDIDKTEVLFVTNRIPLMFEEVHLHEEFITDPQLSLVKFGINFFESIYLLCKYRPSIIISTGAGLSVATFVMGRLLGARTIFIESGCRMEQPSRAGRILYRFSDYFIVQSAELKRGYPRSIVAGVL